MTSLLLNDHSYIKNFCCQATMSVLTDMVSKAAPAKKLLQLNIKNSRPYIARLNHFDIEIAFAQCQAWARAKAVRHSKVIRRRIHCQNDLDALYEFLSLHHACLSAKIGITQKLN